MKLAKDILCIVGQTNKLNKWLFALNLFVTGRVSRSDFFFFFFVHVLFCVATKISPKQ